jgi:chorismate mutase
MKVRAARGAIVVSANTEAAIGEATERLLRAIFDGNAIEVDDLISVLFTATDDLDAAFPALAARRMGLVQVPLLCAREIPVIGSMRSVVRVLVHFHGEQALAEVVHVYLDGAETLRDDLEPSG